MRRLSKLTLLAVGGETIYTGVGYSASFPTRSCGPATDVDMNRKPGCTADLSGVSPFGALSDPGFGPAQWAYRGGELGPPVVLTGEDFLGQCKHVPASLCAPLPHVPSQLLVCVRERPRAAAGVPQGARARRLPLAASVQ